MNALLYFFSFSLASMAVLTGAHAQPALALSKFKRGDLIQCEPNDAFFCGNVHVSCAGKTRVPTFPFALQSTLNNASMTVTPGFESYELLYANSHLNWGEDAPYVVVLPAHERGYIKLFASGNYVFRYYEHSRAEGIMSLGQCK